jgi:acyl-CoA reductase-like NAD-dependent aldehyde dehydrogenase
MVTSAMKCMKCSSQIPDDSAYCKYCGMSQGKTVTEEFSVAAGDVLKKVQELIHEGNITRIIVKDETGKLLLEIPATVGVVGAILAPWMAALGVIAALATKCTIVVERRA